MTTSPDDPRDPDDARAIDAAFDEIVANMGEPGTASSSTPWPPNEADPTPGTRPESEGPLPQRTPRSDWSEWDDLKVPTPEPREDAEDDSDPDEEHYVPPPPPPVPHADRVLRWAWAAAVGAPVLAIVLPLLGWRLDGLLGLALVGAFLTGFVTLVSRLRTGPRVDDGPDDGAVV